MDVKGMREQIKRLEKENGRLRAERQYYKRLSASELEMINSREENLKYQALGTFYHEWIIIAASLQWVVLKLFFNWFPELETRERVNHYLRLTRKGVAHFERRLKLKVMPSGSVIRQKAEKKPERKQKKLAVRISKQIEQLLLPYLFDKSMKLR